ncbi:hypothetical protein Pelo_8444 [Pelomyxa schiedti]|nr:hypothetical protein Pelo_8444 [Pelomyxa schiedti]
MYTIYRPLNTRVAWTKVAVFSAKVFCLASSARNSAAWPLMMDLPTAEMTAEIQTVHARSWKYVGSSSTSFLHFHTLSHWLWDFRLRIGCRQVTSTAGMSITPGQTSTHPHSHSTSPHRAPPNLTLQSCSQVGKNNMEKVVFGT